MSEITVTTTPGIEGEEVETYLGVVSGEAVMGANVVKDFLAGIRDVVGGRSESYEKEILKGRKEAVKDISARAEEEGADAVVGVGFDYEEIREGVLWITVTGTAVRFQ
ncbi:MAG: YbjQ family protein [Candidatus Nanohaloarchaeota archaeon QJJ-9]|nr:YbjQ family protein [Candidatus Nanohaloarchaeota archaeon QJJ-9]